MLIPLASAFRRAITEDHPTSLSNLDIGLVLVDRDAEDSGNNTS